MAKAYPFPEAIEHSEEKTDTMAETFISYGKEVYGKMGNAI